MKIYRIAVIPGDGIGKEVMPEGVRVLDAAARKFGFAHRLEFRLGSCDYYAEARPDDAGGLEGADRRPRRDLSSAPCGWPAKVPDHISLWGSLIQFRREFDQYVNLRPVRLMPGVRLARWRGTASPATSTYWWCARTPRANTRNAAAACSTAPSARWRSRKP